MKATLKNFEQTLAEQLRINQFEYDKRKSLLDLKTEDIEYLVQAKPYISKEIDNIIDSFYTWQLENKDTAALIRDAETLRRLKNAMKHYIYELFEGIYDSIYVDKRLRIGMVHHRIGVSPKLYISAISQLEILLCRLIDNADNSYIPEENKHKTNEALRKLLKLDTELVFDTYIFSLVSDVDAVKAELTEHAENLEQVIAERTQALKESSIRDALTGLYNHRALFDNLRRELSRSSRNNEIVSLIYFDLNGFKKINDRKGHLAGDNVLVTISDIVSKEIREEDIACRYGGDEFCIILPQSTIKDSNLIVDRIIDKCKKEETLSEISFSVGIVSTGPDHYMLIDELVAKADQLMYVSKEKSRHQPGYQITLDTESSMPNDENVTNINSITN